MKFVKVPKRISTIIESESLLNDASSLIVFRFAALVVTTGQLVWTDMVLNFLWVVVAGSLIGLAIAWMMSKMYKYLPTDANMDVILSVIAPYIMYIVANEMGASGVLAVVAGGMYMSLHPVLYKLPLWYFCLFLFISPSIWQMAGVLHSNVR